jgi:hypothetical protein
MELLGLAYNYKDLTCWLELKFMHRVIQQYPYHCHRMGLQSKSGHMLQSFILIRSLGLDLQKHFFFNKWIYKSMTNGSPQFSTSTFKEQVKPNLITTQNAEAFIWIIISIKPNP